MAAGIPWSWTTFPEYLDAVDRLPKGINYAANIGHSALRTYVMGERAFEETRDRRRPRARWRPSCARALARRRDRLHDLAHRRTTRPPTTARSPRGSRPGARCDALVARDGRRWARASSSTSRIRRRRTAPRRRRDELIALAVDDGRAGRGAGAASTRRRVLPMLDQCDARGRADVRPRAIAAASARCRRSGRSCPSTACPSGASCARCPLEEQRRAPRRSRRSSSAREERRRRAVTARRVGGEAAAARLRADAGARRAGAAESDRRARSRARARRRPGRGDDRPRGRERLRRFFVQTLSPFDRTTSRAILRHPRTVMPVLRLRAPTSARWPTPRSRPTCSPTGSATAGSSRFEEAIRMITLEPARAWGFHDRGLVREGLIADLNVLDPGEGRAGDADAWSTTCPAGERRIEQKATGIARRSSPARSSSGTGSTRARCRGDSSASARWPPSERARFGMDLSVD